MDVFISKLDSLLAKDGILTMQMITSADSRYQILKSNVDFIQKHIFPGSLLPSLNRISQAMMSCGDLFLVDLFDMTPSYVRTLRLWQNNFEAKLDQVRAQGFDERFIRKWRYYFEYCQAAFAMRNVSVVQATYSRPNNLRLAEGSRSNA
jgi:cyclopropane-fatty-acyl-phospholipid synthase